MRKQTHCNRVRAFTARNQCRNLSRTRIVGLVYEVLLINANGIRSPIECHVMSLQMNELPGGNDKFVFVCQRSIHHPSSSHPH